MGITDHIGDDAALAAPYNCALANSTALYSSRSKFGLCATATSVSSG